MDTTTRQDFITIGIGGPVGSGKSHLVLELCKALREEFSLIVITNDIYTREDAQFLTKQGVLPQGRIMGVETGGCPHAAIRDDISINKDALTLMRKKFPDASLGFIESGGDNLSANFSPELVDYQIYVIDVAQGDDIPRKGGLGIARSDLLVLNKIDLAPYVGSDIPQMCADLQAARGPLPFVLTNLKTAEGVPEVAQWVRTAFSAGAVKTQGAWSGKPFLTSAIIADHHHGSGHGNGHSHDHGHDHPHVHGHAHPHDHAHGHGHEHHHQ